MQYNNQNTHNERVPPERHNQHWTTNQDFRPRPANNPNSYRGVSVFKNYNEKNNFKRSYTSPPMGSEPRRPNETSPAAKRFGKFQNPFDEQSKNQPQNKKNPTNFTVQSIQSQKEQKWKETFEETIKLLEVCQPGEEVNTIVLHLQPSRAACSSLNETIKSDLMRMISTLGVKELMVFGSTLTSLDFIGSDLDFYIELNIPPSRENIPQLLQKVSKFSRQSNDFRVIYSIQNARVPIIRLLHQKTRKICDINFTSCFGYFNSRFIGQIVSLDKRIKDLAVIIKLWAKAHKVSEKMIMSNYCLVMLMVFYLQNLEQPMIGTIKGNQDGRKPLNIDHWNVFFNNSIDKTFENQLTVRQLLVGFFEFYHKLNYCDYIISLYNGDLILRKDFDNHPDFATYREIVARTKILPLRFEDSKMVIVQDGFELNLNIGIKCHKHVDYFCSLMKESYKLCEELKDESMAIFLIKLFTGPDPELEKKHIGKAKKKFQIKLHAIAGDLKICQDILHAEDKDRITTEDDHLKFYYKHVCSGTIQFLEEVYLCLITQLNNADEDSMQLEMKISLPFDTLRGRKKLNFKDDATVNAEKVLSKKMVENKFQIDLDAIMKISTKDKGKTIDFDMIDNEVQKKSSLPIFGSLFGVNIGSALQFYLKTKLKNVTSQTSQ